MVSSRPPFLSQLVSAEELAFYNAQLPPPMQQQHLKSVKESGGVYTLSFQRSEPDGPLRSVSVPQTPTGMRPPPYLYHTKEPRSDLQKYQSVFMRLAPPFFQHWQNVRRSKTLVLLCCSHVFESRRSFLCRKSLLLVPQNPLLFLSRE